MCPWRADHVRVYEVNSQNDELRFLLLFKTYFYTEVCKDHIADYLRWSYCKIIIWVAPSEGCSHTFDSRPSEGARAHEWHETHSQVTSIQSHHGHNCHRKSCRTDSPHPSHQYDIHWQHCALCSEAAAVSHQAGLCNEHQQVGQTFDTVDFICLRLASCMANYMWQCRGLAKSKVSGFAQRMKLLLALQQAPTIQCGMSFCFENHFCRNHGLQLFNCSP